MNPDAFELSFYICLVTGVLVVINMLHMPVEIEHPENPEVPRIPTDKETQMQRLQFYLREVCAPEHAMKRRKILLFLIVCIGSISLVLHFLQWHPESVNAWMWPSKTTGTNETAV